MPLTAGARLGPYEIVGALGAGGMGEVWRARDTTLGRDVALKILPDHLALDPDRLARFGREAQILASLNHPNIATIHGFHEANGVQALVLELVEGDTLVERLKSGPLPVSEVLSIARQIADALQAAHEKGIIHRDLKPANIAFTADGLVKVLDFGLAKALEPEPIGDVSNSPTMTLGGTQAGVILGTAAYMAPEQAKGRAADKRSDVWAFGCVLYEMLAGKRAFGGDDTSDTLASVLKTEPDWDSLPADVSARVRQVIRVCLQKDPKQRAADIHDVRLALEGAFEAAVPQMVPPARGPQWRRDAAVGAVAVVATALAAGAVWFVKLPPAPRVTRLLITPPSAAALDTAPRIRRIAITPDGTRVVYAGTNGRLFVRALDQLDATPLTGVGDAQTPFVSPDGQWIGFGDGPPYVLRKVAIGGGAPVTVARHNNLIRGATWGSDGTIVFADADEATGLQRVGAAGGDPMVLTRPNKDSGELDHFWPEFLPGGRAVLFTIQRLADEPQVAVLDLRTNVQTTLISGGSDARYVPSGHLVYGAGPSLMAVAFDLGRLSVVGTPVPVVDNVETWAGVTSFTVNISGAVDVAVASDGTMVYVPAATALAEQRTLVWVDRQGREEVISAPPRVYSSPQLSPDGTKVALDVREGDQDIWIWDFARQNLTRLTLDAVRDRAPVWSVDGQRVFFESQREGRLRLFWQSADGTGEPERLGDFESNQAVLQPKAVSPDGKFLLVEYQTSPGRNIGLVDLAGDKQLKPLIEPGFVKDNPALSPDGRWLAYESNESGRFEIYVRPFPAVDTGRWAISANGGERPVWSRDGRELFYLDPKRRLMAVEIRPGASFSAGSPQVVFERPYALTSGGRVYDVSLDGQRFLMIKSLQATEDAEPPSLVVIQHFDEELKRLVPVD